MIKNNWPETFDQAAELLRQENPDGLIEKLDALRKQTPKGRREEFDIYYEGAAMILASRK